MLAITRREEEVKEKQLCRPQRARVCQPGRETRLQASNTRRSQKQLHAELGRVLLPCCLRNELTNSVAYLPR